MTVLRRSGVRRLDRRIGILASALILNPASWFATETSEPQPADGVLCHKSPRPYGL
jgi:hypothetical protein